MGMNFNTREEFYEKREEIRKEYENSTYGAKYLYKLYVYKKVLDKSKKINVGYLDAIWEYLNEPVGTDIYMDAYFKICTFKRRR